MVPGEQNSGESEQRKGTAHIEMVGALAILERDACQSQSKKREFIALIRALVAT